MERWGVDVPKVWADKARRAEMHSGGSDVLANDMTIHLHTSFYVSPGRGASWSIRKPGITPVTCRMCDAEVSEATNEVDIR